MCRRSIDLAATQADIHQRIIVIDISEGRDEWLVLINPELLEEDGETGIEEGCLSIPEQRALVPRAEKVKIRALDHDDKPFELEVDGLLTICVGLRLRNGKYCIIGVFPAYQRRLYSFCLLISKIKGKDCGIIDDHDKSLPIRVLMKDACKVLVR